MKVRFQRWMGKKPCPDRFHYGSTDTYLHSQQIRLDDRAFLLDQFYRVPANENPVQWIKGNIRQIYAGTPVDARRPRDPVTLPSISVREHHQQGAGGRSRRSRRERTPDDESADEEAFEQYFTLDRYEPPEIITPDNFPMLWEGAREPRGEKRDFDTMDAPDEDVVLLSTHDRKLVKPKRTARLAGLKSLEREFGLNLPHGFQRPAYKWVYSPLFPRGLTDHPQRGFHVDGTPRVLPRRSNCPHIITKIDDSVRWKHHGLCDGCDR